MRRRTLVTTAVSIASLVLVMGFSGCTTNNEDTSTLADTEKLSVGVSIVPEQAFVDAVAGDLVNVVVSIPSGSSPENYEPTPQQMTDLENAEVYFSIGVPTEEANILPQVEGTDVEIVDLASIVSESYPERTFDGGGRDPHIWMSPQRAKVMVNTIAQKLGELDSENAETYSENAQAYNEEIDDSISKVDDALSGSQMKSFIAYHPAFGYFADEFGLEMIAVEEEGQEATPEHLMEVVDFAKENNITTIFYQEEISSKQVESIASEIGGKAVVLDPLAYDYVGNLVIMADALSEV